MVHTKRIVLNTFGSFGDLHPYMAIAMELKARGHDPVIATSEVYREKVEASGLQFAPVRPNLAAPADQDAELLQRIMEPRTGVRFLLDEIIFSSIRESYADLHEVVAGADLLVTHAATPAGPLVGRVTGLPWISTVLAPLSFFSAYDPPVPPFWFWTSKLRSLGPRFVRPMMSIAKRGYRQPEFDRLRRELRVADYGNPVFEGQHSPTLVLALFSSVFAPQQVDWPPQSRITGFPFYDGRNEHETPPQLTTFLESGPPPIVFTLGSSAVWVARDFFVESIAAARMLGRRAVLLIGDERNLPLEPLPEDTIAVNYAPYEAVLPRACAMVHHGGVGTTSQGLRAGIPTLIVPFAFDQADNAAHAARLGASRTLYRNEYFGKRVAKQMSVLLEEPQYAGKAKMVGELLRRENGAGVACDLIEQVLQRDQMAGREELVYASGC